MTDCLNQQGVNAILMRLPGKARTQFSDWLKGMSDPIDEQSKRKAYELYENSILDTTETGTIKGLQQIHAYLFEGLYEFAGKIRTKNISKGGFAFANCQFFKEIFSRIDGMPENTLDEIIYAFGGDEDVLPESLGEDVGVLLLGELVGAVVRDEHDDVVQGLAALHVLLVLLARQLLDVAADGLEVPAGGVGPLLGRLGVEIVRQGAQGHLGVDEDVRVVGEVEGEVGAHVLAGLLVLDEVALAVAEPELGVVVVSFAEAFGPRP